MIETYLERYSFFVFSLTVQVRVLRIKPKFSYWSSRTV
nr:MAG TPA: hypothetical protein [Caudoviricetes sp.]